MQPSPESEKILDSNADEENMETLDEELASDNNEVSLDKKIEESLAENDDDINRNENESPEEREISTMQTEENIEENQNNSQLEEEEDRSNEIEITNEQNDEKEEEKEKIEEVDVKENENLLTKSEEDATEDVNTEEVLTEASANKLFREITDVPIVGLEYVVEVVHKESQSSEQIYYICALCSMKLNTTTLLAHVKSVPHMLRYTEIHCHDIHAKYGKIELKKWDPSLINEFSMQLIDYEHTVGRKKMLVCTEDDKFDVVTRLKEDLRMADKYKFDDKKDREGRSREKSDKDRRSNDKRDKSRSYKDKWDNDKKDRRKSDDKGKYI